MITLLRSPLREKISGKYENTISWIGSKYKPILSIAVLALIVKRRISRNTEMIADHHHKDPIASLNSNLGKTIIKSMLVGSALKF